MNDQKLTQNFEAQHPRLIETLYNTSTDHRQWNAFLLELVQATASRSARLLVTNALADEVLYSTKVNIDDNEHQRYVEHFVNTCPWRTELGQKPIGSLYSTYYDFSCDQQAFYQTEFFNDWARQLDIHHGVCGTVYQSSTHKVQMLVQRTRQQGHFSHHSTALINGLLPHVRQALRLSQQQASVNHTLHGASLAAEARALPFVLLDERGRVCHLSSHADLLLQEQSLEIVDGELVIDEPQFQRDYQAGLRRVLASARAVAGSEYAFRLPRVGRAPLDCLLTPIHPAANALNLWPSPGYAALYIYDREQHLSINPAILSQIFDLTDSEARIAADIARGMDPRFIAERDNRSPHTVRAQLKSVFLKTRCHRQSQLAALVLQSPATVRRESAPKGLRSVPET